MSATDIISIIEQYEAQELDYESACTRLREHTSKKVTQDDLDNYWKSISLESFADELACPPIPNPTKLSRSQSLHLITEALDNTTSHIFTRNSTALEVRYSKPSGFVSDLVFYRDLDCPEKILSELEQNTVIHL
jgi:hypothetical protein